MIAVCGRILQEGLVESLTESNHGSKACSMVPLSGPVAEKMLAFGRSIPDEDLYVEEGENKTDSYGGDNYGREKEPHVTALYGTTIDDAEKIKEKVAGFGPVKLTLGEVTIFENDDKPYDVVKADVESEDLHRLNKLLKELPFQSDFPDYHPHATIAYVKKGTGKKYVGKQDFSGEEFQVDKLDFSTSEHVHTIIDLNAVQESLPWYRREFRPPIDG